MNKLWYGHMMEGRQKKMAFAEYDIGHRNTAHKIHCNASIIKIE